MYPHLINPPMTTEELDRSMMEMEHQRSDFYRRFSSLFDQTKHIMNSAKEPMTYSNYNFERDIAILKSKVQASPVRERPVERPSVVSAQFQQSQLSNYQESEPDPEYKEIPRNTGTPKMTQLEPEM